MALGSTFVACFGPARPVALQSTRKSRTEGGDHHFLDKSRDLSDETGQDIAPYQQLTDSSVIAVLMLVYLALSAIIMA